MPPTDNVPLKDWDIHYEHANGPNASWQIYPYGDTQGGNAQNISYVWYTTTDGIRKKHILTPDERAKM